MHMTSPYLSLLQILDFSQIVNTLNICIRMSQEGTYVLKIATVTNQGLYSPIGTLNFPF